MTGIISGGPGMSAQATHKTCTWRCGAGQDGARNMLQEDMAVNVGAPRTGLEGLGLVRFEEAEENGKACHTRDAVQPLYPHLQVLTALRQKFGCVLRVDFL